MKYNFTVEKNFVIWVTNEVNARGWSNSELARQAGLAPSSISMVLSELRQPGFEFCLGIAKALKTPPEEVLRLAGLLPKLPGSGDNSVEQLVELAKELPPEEKQMVLEFAQWRYQRYQGKENGKRRKEPG